MTSHHISPLQSTAGRIISRSQITTMDLLNDKYSIKNLLFTKAIPNYVIPVPTAGHKVFACSDCGDKFILQSSYEYHTNRKSVKISYFCRHCNILKLFYNRCNLLSHIRSHSFKSATINVGDLRVDPLPLNFYSKRTLKAAERASANVSSPTNVIAPANVSAPTDISAPTNVSAPANTKATANADASDNISAPTDVNAPSNNASAPANVNASIFNQEQILEDDNTDNTPRGNYIYCPECNEELSKDKSALAEKRAKHYMQFTNETFTCPFCMFTVPTTCALSTHLRIHFKIPPYLCPECGGHLSNFHYPFDHKCEGFMMMRATVRLKCPAPNCQPFHPNDLKEHLKSKHLRAVFKCPYCYVACFDENIMANHLRNHQQQFPLGIQKSVTFYQCDLCPGKLILQSQVDTHYKKAHSPCNTVYPCWVCGKLFKDMFSLASHHLNSHEMQNYIQDCLQKVLNHQNKPPNRKKVYRVIKRCDQCKRSFSYKCQFEQINNLPNECPYKCTVSSGPKAPENKLLTCCICKHNMSQDWEEIKKHFNVFHPIHRCVDIKVALTKINIDKYLPVKSHNPIKKNILKRLRKKRVPKKEVVVVNDDASDNQDMNMSTGTTGELVCKLCRHECENKDSLEKHLLIHRDPCMAYQCMECGQCFVVKPSFSKHLIIEHNISNTEDYINQKQCYNENALMKYQDNPEMNEPLRENQCKICREQFENSDDLEKHFRVHGMAFLMKNNCNKTSP